MGRAILNARGNRAVFQVLGHLKAGVTPEQAAADLNSIGSWLEKNYPKDHGLNELPVGASQRLMATFWAARCGHF